MSQLPVIFLLGPTASGKTASSIELARHINAEIVSVDSALVYKGMDIGTAKPDMAERDGIAHHIIDVCRPDDAYSVARFCNDATDAIKDIQLRGKQALLTGGTMLYFNALENGIAPLPDANPELRQALTDEAAKIGWEGMHAKLSVVDPIAANRIHPNDPQRVQRALEVYEITGKPLTELQKRTQSFLSVPPLKFALLPDSRPWLHERIGKRFGLMLENGFLEEMIRLKADYNLHANMPSMRSVGYRQAWQFQANEFDRDTMIAKSETATRQLAKRQMTWIRSMDNLNIISCDTQSTDMQVAKMLSELKEVI